MRCRRTYVLKNRDGSGKNIIFKSNCLELIYCDFFIRWIIKIYLFKIQSAKVLLLPPKYEIIMLPFNHLLFRYCNSNIGLFSIAPCKVINLFPLHPFWYQFFASFFMASSLKLLLFQLSRQRQLLLFLALKGDSNKITDTFR